MLSHTPDRLRWRLGVMAALAITFLSLYPQLDLWCTRAPGGTSAYATLEFDEVAYSAYLNALIDGRPRRNDPYTGFNDTPTAPQPETLFSVQFLPPYVLAIPARLFGLDASTIFIVLAPLAAFAAALALFWLLSLITKDERSAAVGVLLVLCFGSIAGNKLALRMMLGLHNPFPYLSYLPFLRRYVPAVPFPLFILFCGLSWRMLTRTETRAQLRSAIGAGLIFALLVYSYFYLWTAASAWLFCLALLWLLARPHHWRTSIRSLSIVAACALAAIIPYTVLLARRATNTDSMVVLKSLHAPDLFRLTELLGAVVLLLLIAAAWRGVVSWRDDAWLFAASFALQPFVVFNQQIVTGFSLQPGHYEKLIANYGVLIALVVTVTLIWRGLKGLSASVPRSLLLTLAVLAFSWCLAETATQSQRNRSINLMRAQERLLGIRLNQLTQSNPATQPANQAVLFSPTLLRVHADSLPTDAPQPPFWAPHTFVFTTSWAEYKERLYQNLYYTGIDERKLYALVNDRNGLIKFVFIAHPTAPLTAATIPQEVQSYLQYAASFDHNRAAQAKLSYLVTTATDDVDLSNLDRWYERDAGERVGELMLYRLRLRP
ncbi:MAG: hypothetical protein ACJ74W_09450 [Pyrinomonadaceae bacterium]